MEGKEGGKGMEDMEKEEWMDRRGREGEREKGKWGFTVKP